MLWDQGVYPTFTHSPNSGSLSPIDARDVSKRRQSADKSNADCKCLLRSIIVCIIRSSALRSLSVGKAQDASARDLHNNHLNPIKKEWPTR